MNSEGSDHPSPTQYLPAPSEPGPLSGSGQPIPDPRAPSPGNSGVTDLAQEAERRHSEWRMKRLFADAEHWMQAMVKHPDGGRRTVAETQADAEEQRRQINCETAKGSRKHQRLPPWQRWIPKLVLFFDFALLLYFFSGITNVDWQSALSVSLAFAIALAGMVTVLAYGFLAFTGHRMRSHKDDAGTVRLYKLDGFTKAALGTALTVIIVLALLMYLRIHSEVIDALRSRSGATILLIPLAVAVISAVANYLVILIHALDGSDEVARLDKLGAATRRLTRKVHRLRKRAVQHAHR